MTTTTIEKHCSICQEENSLYLCQECSSNYCFNHLQEHRDIVNQEINHIEDESNIFRQILIDSKTNIKKYYLIEQINQWENNSIKIIKQTAEEFRQKLNKYLKKTIDNTDYQLNQFVNEVKSIRKKHKFNENKLEELNQKLNRLHEKFNEISNVSIQQTSAPVIQKISLFNNIKWNSHGLTIAGGNRPGNQLSSPNGICIDNDDQTMYIADYENHRIMEWKANTTSGRIVAGGNGKGNQTNQLNHPTHVISDKQTNSLIIADQGNKRIVRWSLQTDTKSGEILIVDIDCEGLTMNKDGDLYVADCKKNEVKKWKKGKKNGIVVAGGNGKGDQLNQLNNPTCIFIDENDSLYVSDRDNHRVIKWKKDAKEGIIVAGGNGKGNSLTQLSGPRGIVVDELGQIYVANYHNDRIMRWCEGDKEGTIVVGGNGQGKQANQLNGPYGLSFDREGNFYVADCRNHRIQKFEFRY